ncbi:MAG TPA: hypothetical protein VGR87_06340 [Candidatus Limnocylindria bacterium]|nr:hypothetical protein [Candidatus Limnocylindria bacterium]
MTDDEGQGVSVGPTGLTVETGNDVVDTLVNLHTDPIGTIGDAIFGDDDDEPSAPPDYPIQFGGGLFPTTYVTSDGKTFTDKAEAEAHQQLLEADLGSDLAEQVNSAFSGVDLTDPMGMNEAAENLSETLNDISSGAYEETTPRRIDDKTLTYDPVALSATDVNVNSDPTRRRTIGETAMPGGREEARNAATAADLGVNQISTDRLGGIAGRIPDLASATGLGLPTSDVSLTSPTGRAIPTVGEVAMGAGLPDPTSARGKSAEGMRTGFAVDPRVAAGSVGTGPSTGFDFAREQLDEEAKNQQLGISDEMDEGELQDLADQANQAPGTTAEERAQTAQEIGAAPAAEDQAKADDLADKAETHGESPAGDFGAPIGGDTAVATPNPEGADAVTPRTAEFRRWLGGIGRTRQPDPSSMTPSDPGREGSGTGAARMSPQESRMFGEELARSRTDPYTNPQPEGDGPVAGAEEPEFVNTLVDPQDMAAGGLLGGAGLQDPHRPPEAEGPPDGDEGTPDN